METGLCESYADRIYSSVCEMLNYKYSHKEITVTGDVPDRKVNSKFWDPEGPSCIVARIEIGMDTFDNSILYMVHFPRKGRLQVYLGSTYPDSFFTESCRNDAEEVFCYPVYSFYSRALELTGEEWEKYCANIKLEYGIEMDRMPFALSLIDTDDEENYEKLIDCEKLAKLMRKTILSITNE